MRFINADKNYVLDLGRTKVYPTNDYSFNCSKQLYIGPRVTTVSCVNPVCKNKGMTLKHKFQYLNFWIRTFTSLHLLQILLSLTLNSRPQRGLTKYQKLTLAKLSSEKGKVKSFLYFRISSLKITPRWLCWHLHFIVSAHQALHSSSPTHTSFLSTRA